LFAVLKAASKAAKMRSHSDEEGVLATGRRAPRRVAAPDPSEDDLEGKPEPVTLLAVAEDAFTKACAERICELNGYLSKFVFREIGADFLSTTELFRRIQTSAYQGRRPSVPQFETYVRWLEWLNLLRKVGFRHKATPAGREIGLFYKGSPDEELLTLSKEDDLPERRVETEPAGETAEHASPVLVPNQPQSHAPPRGPDSDEADDEVSELVQEEGLDLPPEGGPAAQEVVPYWVKPNDNAPRLAPLSTDDSLPRNLSNVASRPDPLRVAPAPHCPPAIAKNLAEPTAAGTPRAIADQVLNWWRLNRPSSVSLSRRGWT
jgi:hypothetical protein